MRARRPLPQPAPASEDRRRLLGRPWMMRVARCFALLWSAALGTDPRTSCSSWATTSAGAICRLAGPRRRASEWTRRGGDRDAGRALGRHGASRTRASVLTGRNHFRDCVDYVYDCSDMTERIGFRSRSSARSRSPTRRRVGRGYAAGSAASGTSARSITTPRPTAGSRLAALPRLRARTRRSSRATATANWRGRGLERVGVEFGHYGKPNHCEAGEPGRRGAARRLLLQLLDGGATRHTA